MSVRFGRFVFDEASRELRVDGRRVPLSPKAFELLAVLLRERPRALSKAELHDRLWPDTFVGETSLPRVVGEIRRALGERPGSRPSCAPSSASATPSWGRDRRRRRRRLGAAAGPRTGCALLWGERLVPLAAGENLVGRDPECALTIPSASCRASTRASWSTASGSRSGISAARTARWCGDGAWRERWRSPTGTS